MNIAHEKQLILATSRLETFYLLSLLIVHYMPGYLTASGVCLLSLPVSNRAWLRCSFVVGMGKNPPAHAQNPAASCPPAPATCNYVNNYLSSTPNTNILYGALVEGNGFTDIFVVSLADTP